MPKYLIQASYTADGLKGLMKDKASGRKAAAAQLMKGAGGKLESMYFAFGEHDIVGIADFPDNVSAAAVALTVSASGLVHVKTTPLLTVEETDKALGKSVAYRAPGK
jgi:uncharacterized protein with GYD domain